MRLPLLRAAAVLALAPALAAAGEMKDALTIDWSHQRTVQTRFAVYGSRTKQCVFLEKDGFRLALPAGAEALPQTGVYSTFTLAGDCQVTLTYELLALTPPAKGYGAGLGLAFDAGDDVGRGSIQRVFKPGEGGGYVLQTALPTGKEMHEEYRFVPTKARQGRIGLRREGKELVFLAAGNPTGELEELDRLPFTERTIQAVRLFADSGGSPTAVDGRLRQLDLRAEEVTGGVPKAEVHTSPWWWLLLAVPVGCAALLIWAWRVRQQGAGAEEKPAVRRKAPRPAASAKQNGARPGAITTARNPKR
jgi:hypothetical protein